MTVHTVAEAAAIMRCSEDSVYVLLNTGHLRGFRVGKGGWRITSEALDQYMAGTQVAS
jgi:excisionase family DNA binding protein